MENFVKITVETIGPDGKAYKQELSGLGVAVSMIKSEDVKSDGSGYTVAQFVSGEFDQPRVHAMLEALDSLKNTIIKESIKRYTDHLTSKLTEDDK